MFRHYVSPEEYEDKVLDVINGVMLKEAEIEAIGFVIGMMVDNPPHYNRYALMLEINSILGNYIESLKMYVKSEGIPGLVFRMAAERLAK